MKEGYLKEECRDARAHHSGEGLAAPAVPGEIEPLCQRCGFPVTPKPEGCKNPCSNCGFLYPLGDCSD